MCLCNDGYKCIYHRLNNRSLDESIQATKEHLESLLKQKRTQIKQERLRKKALAKLTKEEREALGLE